MKLEFGKRPQAIAFEQAVEHAKTDLLRFQRGKVTLSITERRVALRWGADAVSEAKRRMEAK